MTASVTQDLAWTRAFGLLENICSMLEVSKRHSTSMTIGLGRGPHLNLRGEQT